MAKVQMTLEVVNITRKGEHLGYKIYLNDFEHITKLPRKPGDLNREAHTGFLQPGEDPVDYYTGTIIEAVQQALIDWQIWKGQGYKRAD